MILSRMLGFGDGMFLGSIVNVPQRLKPLKGAGVTAALKRCPTVATWRSPGSALPYRLDASNTCGHAVQRGRQDARPTAGETPALHKSVHSAIQPARMSHREPVEIRSQRITPGAWTMSYFLQGGD